MAYSPVDDSVNPDPSTAPFVPAAVDPLTQSILNLNKNPAPVIPGARRQSLAQDIATAESTAGSLFGPRFRIWLYGVIIAAMPVLELYGIVNGSQAQVWTDLAQSVLATTGLVTAVANINRA